MKKFKKFLIEREVSLTAEKLKDVEERKERNSEEGKWNITKVRGKRKKEMRWKKDEREGKKEKKEMREEKQEDERKGKERQKKEIREKKNEREEKERRREG